MKKFNELYAKIISEMTEAQDSAAQDQDTEWILGEDHINLDTKKTDKGPKQKFDTLEELKAAVEKRIDEINNDEKITAAETSDWEKRASLPIGPGKSGQAFGRQVICREKTNEFPGYYHVSYAFFAYEAAKQK